MDLLIGKRLQEQRSFLGLTQEDLAERIKLSPQQLQKYEKPHQRGSTVSAEQGPAGSNHLVLRGCGQGIGPLRGMHIGGAPLDEAHDQLAGTEARLSAGPTRSAPHKHG
jgi:hypothetical protein